MKYLATIFITFILTLILLKQCGQPKQVNQTVITQTKHIIDSLKTITYHDTIEKIKTKYRNRIDTVRRWLYDSTWNNVCTIAGYAGKAQECQREVARRILCGERDSQYLVVFRKIRQNDSLIISNYGDLELEQAGQILAYEREMAAKNKAIKRRRWINRVVYAVGAVLLVVK